MPINIGSKRERIRRAERVYAAIFAEAPCPFLVLTPELEIVDGNPAYLSATGRSRDALVGRHMFDAFPDNPGDPLADGVCNLRRSFESALRFGTRQQMPLQRYDVQDPRGRWNLRYWTPANWAVMDDGRPMALVHHVIDVTERAQAQMLAPGVRHLGLLERADWALHNARRLAAEVRQDMDRARRNAELARARSRRPN